MQADNQVEQNRKHFYELSLEYVCKLQEIQERKKFECVEPVSIQPALPSMRDGGGMHLDKSQALLSGKHHQLRDLTESKPPCYICTDS